MASRNKPKSRSKKKAKKPKAKAAVTKTRKRAPAKAAARRSSKKKKPRTGAKKKKTAARRATVKRAVSVRATAGLAVEALESVQLRSDAGLLEALERKLEAIKALRTRLREVVAREGSTLRTDAALNALNTAEGRLGARIAAVETPTLSPPGAEKVAALREAIRTAEEVIRKNQAVNELLAATTQLLATLQD